MVQNGTRGCKCSKSGCNHGCTTLRICLKSLNYKVVMNFMVNKWYLNKYNYLTPINKWAENFSNLPKEIYIWKIKT
jgi:hypothetical protein